MQSMELRHRALRKALADQEATHNELQYEVQQGADRLADAKKQLAAQRAGTLSCGCLLAMVLLLSSACVQRSTSARRSCAQCVRGGWQPRQTWRCAQQLLVCPRARYAAEQAL